MELLIVLTQMIKVKLQIIAAIHGSHSLLGVWTKNTLVI